MNLADPLQDVVAGPRGLVLRTLVRLEEPVSVRTLARHAGVSPQGALDLVRDLEAAGLVTVGSAGGALLVVLNRDHLAAGPLAELTRLSGLLVERLQEELGGWSHLDAAWLFGSAARHDGARSSDIDLLLVADTSLDDPAWVRSVDHLSEQVLRWTGNAAQALEHTSASFDSLDKGTGGLVDHVRTEGIPLTATSRERLRTGRR